MGKKDKKAKKRARREAEHTSVEEIADIAANGTGDPSIHGVVVVVIRSLGRGNIRPEIAAAGGVCCERAIMSTHAAVNEAVARLTGQEPQAAVVIVGEAGKEGGGGGN